MTDPPPAAAPADWYPDPDQPATQRYWDGERWTDARRPLRAASAAAGASRSTAFWVATGSVAALTIGSIGPWVDAGFVTAGGLDGDGVITILMAAVAALVLLRPRPDGSISTTTLLIAGVIAAATAIYDIANIESQTGLAGAIASPGWGLILSAIASVALVASATAVRRGP